MPVARICVDVPLPHLDRPFDYLVPAALDAAAQPGVRVKVRFAGQLADGYLLERVTESDHDGKLTFLDKVVSPEPVLRPEIAALAREIADRYAGTMSDVLRLAIPPRHAAAEKSAAGADAAAGGRASSPSTSAERSAVAGGAVAGGAVAGGAAAGRPAVTGSAVTGSAVAGAAAAGKSAAEGFAAAGDAPAGMPPAGGGVAAVGSAAAGDVAAGVPVAKAGVVAGEPVARASAAAGMSPATEGGRNVPAVSEAGWRQYTAGVALLRALGDGRRPHAVWTALPGEDWPARLAEAAASALAGGRGSLIVVADARDLDRLDKAMTTALGGAGAHVALSAALGPAERYRRFLAASRGRARVVIGTRAACFAPVDDLGLVAIWDDGDDLHAEPRAPYPHARQVLLARAEQAGCGIIVGGFARTAEAQQLIETGWAIEVAAARGVLRRHMPQVVTVGEDEQMARDPGAVSARLPTAAWRAARDALLRDAPVLIQVPRRGYIPSVACAECYTAARCPNCSGPLALPSATAPPLCRWCGRVAAAYACPECGSRRLRASVVGARRTAEELARAFPDTPVRTSGRDGVLDRVPGQASIVVSTPGAEPVADGGYGAVLLLDSWALLTRADLRGTEEALRRWLTAAALTRRTGTVVVVADASLAVVQALVRFDPGWLAARELADRRELGFPPVMRMASLTGTPAAVADLLAAANLPPGAEVLGPVPAADGQERMLVRTGRSAGRALALALRSAAGLRSARRAADPVRVQVDPLDLL
ncbi:primosomal protein N' [Dactylosporangium sp. NPDC005555]|uniref:primosomal protein N' n=1 Tax=Dactylosporangium sp. NPDC005555 TaxID=3154889 RepID=UPI00339F7D3E